VTFAGKAKEADPRTVDPARSSTDKLTGLAEGL
jgi:hypothetical protein